MTISKLYERMFSAIKEGTIEAVQKAAYAYFGLPVALCDTSFDMLAPDYPNDLQNDEVWDIPNITRRVPYEQIELFENHHLIEEVICNPHKTIFCNWGWFADHPRLTTGIYIDEVHVGYLAVLLSGSDYPSHFDEGLQITSDAFGMVLKQAKLDVSSEIDKKELIAKSVFQKDFSQIEKAVELHYIIPKAYYRIIAANYSPYQQDFSTLLDKIRHLPVLYMKKNHVLYLLTSQEKNNTDTYLVSVIKALDYKCGLSVPFSDIDYIDQAIMQAKEALNIGRQKAKGLCVYDYLDYAVDIICSRVENETYLLHPLLKQLRQYDKEHETNYYLTLKTYVHYSHSLDECFSVLHIHRNTLTYRLNKIQEIGDVNLSNQYTLTHLLLSFLMES